MDRPGPADLAAHLAELLTSIDADAELAVDLELRAAKARLATGHLAEATELLAAAATRPLPPNRKPELAAHLLELARAWSARRDDAEAARHAEAALRLAVSVAPARALPALAQFLQRQGRFAEAATTWQDAIQAAPQESSAYLSLARLYERTERPEHALGVYLELSEAVPTMRNRLTVAPMLDDLAQRLPAAPVERVVRIALLGNATLDHLQSYLKIACFRAGLRPHFYQCGFDQYSQDILDPRSGLYALAPDIVVCAVHPSRLFPNLHADPSALSVAERQAEIEIGLQTLRQLLDTFTERSSALVLLHNMVVPQHPALGILDTREELGQGAAFAEINTRLMELARTRYKSVYIVDEDRIQGRHGKRDATDPRMWFSARLPWSDAVLNGLVDEYLRFIRAYKGLNRKCIVLDLDHTLWGGVIGEDGLAGIQLGSEAPGNAFVAFQRELEKLWRRGVLLAVCSKNNVDDAVLALDHHPDMVLRSSHFAARRINWSPKAANIREIAAELNIGLSSLVFLDDNPVERAQVRAELPEVLVPDLPTDPAGYRGCLLELGVFDTLALTEEDRMRNRLYVEQQARRQAEGRLAAGGSIEDYLRDLGLVVEIDAANDLTLPRIAQLTTKTNQFNLTTRRYTEAEIRERIGRGWRVFGARVKDRFGDNGLTGVIMVDPEAGDVWTIDTLLLSCRVMGRGVETALLALVSEHAVQAGASHLRGWFRPTGKNEPARECYGTHGFQVAQQADDGSVLWDLDLSGATPVAPAWLRVRTPMAAG